MKRKLHGVQAVECFRGGVIISGRPLMLVAKRAGLSFKFIGHDLQTCETYIGYVYEPVVLEVLQRDGRVKAWQKELVAELLVTKLALVDAIPAPTMELETFNRNRTLIIHVEKGPSVSTHGKRHVSLRRVLRDQFKAMRKFEKVEAKQRTRRIGFGLGRYDFEILPPLKIEPRDPPVANKTPAP
jgi:hypothetical protein